MASVGQMIEQVLAHMDGRPAWEVMQADEIERGNDIIRPGEVSWLPKDDWDEHVTISKSGREIRLIAILALHPGGGAFRRLVEGILGAGLVPVIIAPTADMRATLKRWNWFPRYVGNGWDREEQWRPRKSWRPTSHAPYEATP